ncbi:hypothetical protein B0T17DRAFT_489304 [Bombardia bombarda]|uniref:Rhodopsin domain-containing protein n=1 Tax=Bombardia bombarda TaxID=252184 RepID=A0AA39XB04_9PEZI|nr:hypothetical protein B0T17DRAFT_489304 [Bombardia bombarda]
MSLYSDPPPLRAFVVDKPTLLVCWWITIFCAVIILLRVCGRFVRTERLFREDKMAALALLPLFLRMGCVHFILVHGTNNAQLEGVRLSEDALRRKSIASGLVLLSRILYAATLWILKSAVLEFFKRLNVSWERSYELTLLFIRCTLIATFVAVVISDLAECQPFSHYWQVLPDPGPQCRQGYAQLLTMAVCNVITDLLLVFLPIPIIIRSQMTTKRKVQLVLLFSLSLAIVAVTIYRVPHIIEDNGSQQSRSLYASVELLFATAASNALVLGSFVRDRGVKKKKFKYDSVAAGSMERSSGSGSRRPTMNRHWGSDEDLVRDVGYGVKPDLREVPNSPTDTSFYTPAPLATFHEDMHLWQFPGGGQQQTQQQQQNNRTSGTKSDDFLLPADQTSASPGKNNTSRRVSFFDYGGLLNDETDVKIRRESNVSMTNGSVSPHNLNGVPTPSIPASASGVRRGSTALLQDIGGFLNPSKSSKAKPAKSCTELQPIQHQQQHRKQSKKDERRSPSPTKKGSVNSMGKPEPVLMDIGGLLSGGKK